MLEKLSTREKIRILLSGSSIEENSTNENASITLGSDTTESGESTAYASNGEVKTFEKVIHLPNCQ